MDEFILDREKTYSLSVNIGEVMALENYIQNYQEDIVEDRVSAIPINRPATFTKELLLKVASAYVELYSTRNDMDAQRNIACTEDELWILRQVVPPNVTFNNVSITPSLKKKILEGIVYLNNDFLDYKITSKDVEQTKYDVAEDIIEWRRQNPL